jgi:hypothetical protein
MNKFKYFAILLIVTFPLITLADTSVCTVEIEDVNASVKNKSLEKSVVKQTFNFQPGANPLTAKQTKFFELPDGLYLCRLDFFDMNTGTSLSCEKKKHKGYTYMQSDLSGIKPNTSRNNLTFRAGKSHFVINSVCE